MDYDDIFSAYKKLQDALKGFDLEPESMKRIREMNESLQSAFGPDYVKNIREMQGHIKLIEQDHIKQMRELWESFLPPENELPRIQKKMQEALRNQEVDELVRKQTEMAELVRNQHSELLDNYKTMFDSTVYNQLPALTAAFSGIGAMSIPELSPVLVGSFLKSPFESLTPNIFENLDMISKLGALDTYSTNFQDRFYEYIEIIESTEDEIKVIEIFHDLLKFIAESFQKIHGIIITNDRAFQIFLALVFLLFGQYSDHLMETRLTDEITDIKSVVVESKQDVLEKIDESCIKKIYVISAEGVRLRSGPGIEHEIISTLNSRIYVELIATFEEWFYIEYMEGTTLRKGWISKEFAVEVSDENTD